MKKEKTSLWLLFWTFAKMGVMTFGGGYAMLPILQREVIDNRGWATEEELMDYFAIGQCTPGIIAVNTATFIGQKLRGIAGGITATPMCAMCARICALQAASRPRWAWCSPLWSSSPCWQD